MTTNEFITRAELLDALKKMEEDSLSINLGNISYDVYAQKFVARQLIAHLTKEKDLPIASDSIDHLESAAKIAQIRLERASHDDKSEYEDSWLEADRLRIPCSTCNGEHEQTSAELEAEFNNNSKIIRDYLLVPYPYDDPKLRSNTAAALFKIESNVIKLREKLQRECDLGNYWAKEQKKEIESLQVELEATLNQLNDATKQNVAMRFIHKNEVYSFNKTLFEYQKVLNKIYSEAVDGNVYKPAVICKMLKEFVLSLKTLNISHETKP